jgi:quercetin dioxygenase-like cupin family protein
MSLSNFLLETQGLKVMIYDFTHAGDELASHAHTEYDNHISVVARGKFRVTGNDWTRDVSAGAYIDWKPGQVHGFVALEPNSRLINVQKDYANGRV